jgi:outer membrane receptor for ferrienterochelin and colicins
MKAQPMHLQPKPNGQPNGPASARRTPLALCPIGRAVSAGGGCRRLICLAGGLAVALTPCLGEDGLDLVTGEARVPEITELQPILEQITIANRHNQPFIEAPTFVSVVSADEIQKSGYRTLAEILLSVPSLYVSYDRDYTFLGTRGFNRGDFNGRMLVLVNGHRVNNNLSDGADVGTPFILDVDLIERVEVVRGPGSVLYGNNAFFGVINVVTRKGSDTEKGHVGGEVTGSVGDFHAYQARATFGRQVKVFGEEVEFLFSGTYFDRGGDRHLYFPEYDKPTSNLGIAENLDHDRVRSGFGSLGWKSFTLEGAWVDREKGVPTAPIGTEFNNPDTKTRDERGYVNLRFEQKFLDEKLNLTARLHYDRYVFDGHYPYADTPDVLQQYWGEWWGAEAEAQCQLTDWYQFKVGGEYRDDFRQDVLITELPGTAVLDVAQTRQSYGVYLHNTFTLLSGEDTEANSTAAKGRGKAESNPQRWGTLYLDAGARYDHFSSFGDTANPRAALIYSPSVPLLQDSTFKFVYGSAFRAPNVRELIFNPNLDPETIRSYEFIFERQWGTLSKHGLPLEKPHYLRSTLALFYNDIEHLIAFDDAAQELRNIQGAKSMGVETAVIGYFSGRSILRGDGMYQASLSYTYQDTEDRNTHRTLTDSPHHLGKARLSLPIFDDNWFLTGEYQYTSERTTPKGSEAPGYGVANLVLFCKDLLHRKNVEKALTVSAGIYNLFDRKYEDPAGSFYLQDTIEQDGRTFLAKLSYAF